MAYIPQPPPIPRNRDMAFYEERERMRKNIQKSSNSGTSGDSGTYGDSGISGVKSHSEYGCSDIFSGNTFNLSGSTQNFLTTEPTSKKIKPNIQPILSEREKVKTSWKFWKK